MPHIKRKGRSGHLENFLLSFNVISPLLLLLAVGVLLKKIKFLSPVVTRAMNKVVALVLLPVLVFKNIYSADTGDLFNGNVLLFCFIGILAEFGMAWAAATFLTKDKNKRGVMLQGMFRSNYVIFGIPIAVSLYGESGSAATAILTTVVIPAFNILAVFALEMYNGNKINVLSILRKIVTNPLIIASVAGLALSALQIRLPGFIEKPINDLAAAATPMAFVFLGASFAFNDIKDHFKELVSTVTARLVLFPLIIVTTAVLLGYNGVWLVAILTVFASPTAVSSFSLSQTLGGDDKLAGNIVVFTSAVSIITMFTWIFVLKSILLI